MIRFSETDLVLILGEIGRELLGNTLKVIDLEAPVDLSLLEENFDSSSLLSKADF